MAQTLDPQLAETHLARFQLLFSQYEGYQGEAAVREVLSAQHLNPNIGHVDLGYLYIHLGLEDPFYHHATYDIVCIFALEGKSGEAVKWLRETAASGYQPYPLFERDPYLNRIRPAPEFIQFMGEMKAQLERYRREFGGAVQG